MKKKDIQMFLDTHGQDFNFSGTQYKVYPTHIIKAILKDYLK